LKDVSFKKFGNDVCIEAYILKEDGEWFECLQD
jgi:hypothetical protein